MERSSASATHDSAAGGQVLPQPSPSVAQLSIGRHLLVKAGGEARPRVCESTATAIVSGHVALCSALPAVETLMEELSGLNNIH